MKNIVIKNIQTLTGLDLTGQPKCIKDSTVQHYLNPTKYELIGYIDRTNEAVLQARYHSVRRANGRFAKVKNRS